jgi:ABC-type oligopeptide transport system substrate-binding subunit
MKMKKRILFISMAFIFALSMLLSACSEDGDVTSYYAYSYFSEFSGDPSSMAIVEAYLNGVNCYKGTKTFTSKSESENDKKAKELFDENVVKIKQDALALLLTGRDVRFVYSAETVNLTEGYRVVGSKEFTFTK